MNVLISSGLNHIVTETPVNLHQKYRNFGKGNTLNFYKDGIGKETDSRDGFIYLTSNYFVMFVQIREVMSKFTH